MEQDFKFIVYENQISGKQPKLITDCGTKIMKGYHENQFNFYAFINSIKIGDSDYHLTRFLPHFYGKIDLGNQAKIVLELNKRRSEAKRKQQSNKCFSEHDQKQQQRIQNNDDFSKWLEHIKNRYQKRNSNNRFIILKNLTQGYGKVNAFDIKIGTRTKDKSHKINFSVQNFHFKLNGIKIQYPHRPDQPQTNYFLSKYFLSEQIKSQADIKLYIAFFFFQGQKLNIKNIQCVIGQLKQLILALKSFHSYKFISSSLLILSDPTRENLKVQVKMIDFVRARPLSPIQPYDTHSSEGIANLISFLTHIIENVQIWQKKVKQKSKFFYENQYKNLVIPQRKLKQYQSEVK